MEIYLFARDVVKGVRAKINWRQADLFHHIELGEYLDDGNFVVLPIEGRKVCR